MNTIVRNSKELFIKAIRFISRSLAIGLVLMFAVMGLMSTVEKVNYGKSMAELATANEELTNTSVVMLQAVQRQGEELKVLKFEKEELTAKVDLLQKQNIAMTTDMIAVTRQKQFVEWNLSKESQKGCIDKLKDSSAYQTTVNTSSEAFNKASSYVKGFFK